MFRKMRRKNREIQDRSVIDTLLETSRIGVLAVNGDEGYPYAIPINYYFDKENNKIYFHGSKEGHKVDSLKKNNKVCFTVYGKEIVKDEEWAPYVQSVVVFGKCHLLETTLEALDLLRLTARKYYPSDELIEEEINMASKAVQIYVIDIENITGKEIQEK